MLQKIYNNYEQNSNLNIIGAGTYESDPDYNNFDYGELINTNPQPVYVPDYQWVYRPPPNTTTSSFTITTEPVVLKNLLDKIREIVNGN